MRVRGPGAAGECQVRLLERRGRDGVRLLGENKTLDILDLNSTHRNLSGEEEDHAPPTTARPRERYYRQLCAHLQARRVQDQEDRGPGPLQNPLVTSHFNHCLRWDKWNKRVIGHCDQPFAQQHVLRNENIQSRTCIED